MRNVCRILLLLSLLAACGKSPADELKTQLQASASWAATAQMTGEAWMSDAVPKAYARRTLDTTRQSFQDEMKTLREQSATIVEKDRASALEHLQKLENIVRQMREAVQIEDRASMSQHIIELRAEEESLDALAKSLGGGR